MPLGTPAGGKKETAPLDLDHTTAADFAEVYEPQEDTYLLLDTLLAERARWQALAARGDASFLEIGSGSGVNISYLAQLVLGKQPPGGGQDAVDATARRLRFFATDVNPAAVALTARTAAHYGVPVTAVRSRFADELGDDACPCDVVLFNPPYVPTDASEIGASAISASWAGGERGRVVIDDFLANVLPGLLARTGVCLMVVVRENEPDDIVATMLAPRGLTGRLISHRKAANEHLSIMLIEWADKAGVA